MKKSVVTNPETLDEEWEELILLALNSGIAPEEIKNFLWKKEKAAYK